MAACISSLGAGAELEAGVAEAEEVSTATVESAAPNYEALVNEAQGLYPKLAGKMQMHHITPKYIGGEANGPVVELDAAYHQVITNEFRRNHRYGIGKPTETKMLEIVHDVYKKYPLSSGN